MENFAVLHSLQGVDKCAIRKGLEFVEQKYFERFGSIRNRNFCPGLLVADARIANVVLKIKFDDELENGDKLFESVYSYLRDPDRYSAYIQEFFELCHECPNLMSSFCDETCDGALVVIDAILEGYMERVSSVFTKFPGTRLELGYLQFMQKIPITIFENRYFENDGLIMKTLIQRLFHICQDSQSTTLQVKSVAFMVLSRILYSTSIHISDVR